jgi:hypothetical protein
MMSTHMAVSIPLLNNGDGNEVPHEVLMQAWPEASDDEEVVLSVFTTQPRLGRTAPLSLPLTTPTPISSATPIIPPATPVATVVQQHPIPAPPNMDPVTIQPNVDALQALKAYLYNPLHPWGGCKV